MDIYDQIMTGFDQLTPLSEWSEMRLLFDRVAQKKPFYWILPAWACKAVGGSDDAAVSAALAIACSQISIILVDDMLDRDPRGEYRLIGEAAAANMACAFQAAGAIAIDRSLMQPKAKLEALTALDQMASATALGQYWDSTGRMDENSYWKIVQTKSSPFFGTSLFAGAVLGGAEAAVAQSLKDLGAVYGEMIQIHDDLNDSMEVPASPDWGPGRNSLPLLFAETVDHPDRLRFLELRTNEMDADKLAEAQSILIRCGAISYGIDQLVRRYRKCQELLQTIRLVDPSGMEKMVEKVILPVRKMFESLSVAQPFLPPTKPSSNGGASGGTNPN